MYVSQVKGLFHFVDAHAFASRVEFWDLAEPAPSKQSAAEKSVALLELLRKGTSEAEARLLEMYRCAALAVRLSMIQYVWPEVRGWGHPL